MVVCPTTARISDWLLGDGQHYHVRAPVPQCVIHPQPGTPTTPTFSIQGTAVHFLRYCTSQHLQLALPTTDPSSLPHKSKAHHSDAAAISALWRIVLSPPLVQLPIVVIIIMSATTAGSETPSSASNARPSSSELTASSSPIPPGVLRNGF